MPHWDTFISHASDDKAKVRRLIALLKARDLDPWIDEAGVQFGGLLRDGLQDAIESSKTFVLIWKSSKTTVPFVWAKSKSGTAGSPVLKKPPPPPKLELVVVCQSTSIRPLLPPFRTIVNWIPGRP